MRVDALSTDIVEGGEQAAGIDWSGPDNLDIVHCKMEGKGPDLETFN